MFERYLKVSTEHKISNLTAFQFYICWKSSILCGKQCSYLNTLKGDLLIWTGVSQTTPCFL